MGPCQSLQATYYSANFPSNTVEGMVVGRKLFDTLRDKLLAGGILFFNTFFIS